MATLSEKKRDSLKESQFGLPEERKYPMPDESHARNAKARAAQQVKKGNLSKSDEKKIDAKADKILDEKPALRPSASGTVRNLDGGHTVETTRPAQNRPSWRIAAQP